MAYFEKLSITLSENVFFGSDAKLRIFIDDMQKPRMSAFMADLLLNNGLRPVNMCIVQGQMVHIKITDIINGFPGVGLKMEFL